VTDYDNDSKSTLNEVCSDSEEEWDEDELQETIPDMKSDHLVMNNNEDLQDEDELGEVGQSEDKNDEVAEDVTPAPRTTRSGKIYAQVVERGIEYSRESGLPFDPNEK